MQEVRAPAEKPTRLVVVAGSKTYHEVLALSYLRDPRMEVLT